jgi:hypothetical protein
MKRSTYPVGPVRFTRIRIPFWRKASEKRTREPLLEGLETRDQIGWTCVPVLLCRWDNDLSYVGRSLWRPAVWLLRKGIRRRPRPGVREVERIPGLAWPSVADHYFGCPF